MAEDPRTSVGDGGGLGDVEEVHELALGERADLRRLAFVQFEPAAPLHECAEPRRAVADTRHGGGGRRRGVIAHAVWASRLDAGVVVR